MLTLLYAVPDVLKSRTLKLDAVLGNRSPRCKRQRVPAGGGTWVVARRHHHFIGLA